MKRKLIVMILLSVFGLMSADVAQGADHHRRHHHERHHHERHHRHMR